MFFWHQLITLYSNKRNDNTEMEDGGNIYVTAIQKEKNLFGNCFKRE